MRRGTNLFIFGATILLAVGCATVPVGERPEIGSVSTRVVGVDFDGVDVAIDLRLENSYSVPLETPRFRYAMDLEGSRFFESESTAGFGLPPGKVSTVTLELRLPYWRVFRSYPDLIEAAEAKYVLEGELIVLASGRSLEFPVSQEGGFPILRPPTFSNVDVQFSDISLTKTRVSVEAVVKNPNSFAVGIESLGYAVRVGNVQIGGLTATAAEEIGAGETGRLHLSGEISAVEAVSTMAGGYSNSSEVVLVATGPIETPYGPVVIR